MRITENKRPRGRPGRYAKYEQLLASLPNSMTKRPLYVDQIGLFKGARGVTAWVKVRHPDRKSSEIKLSNGVQKGPPIGVEEGPPFQII